MESDLDGDSGKGWRDGFDGGSGVSKVESSVTRWDNDINMGN